MRLNCIIQVTAITENQRVVSNQLKQCQNTIAIVEKQLITITDGNILKHHFIKIVR